MAVSLSLARPKSTTTNSVTFDISLGTPVEVDSTEESIFLPFNLASTNPASFTVSSVTTTNSSATITTTGGGFANVKVGDVLSGTGIDVGATVASKTANNNSITMSAPATASGTITLTVDPPAGTPTVFALKLVYGGTGSNVLSITPTLHLYDGSLAPGTVGTAANSTSNVKLQRIDSKPISIDIDAFLTAFRVARSS